MADIAHADENAEPVAIHAARETHHFVLSIVKLLAGRLIPNRSLLLFFVVILLALVLGLNIFLEENLARFGWGILLSHSGVEAPTGLALMLVVGTVGANRLRRPATCRKPSSIEDMERAVKILSVQPNASAGLVRLGDKKILLSDCEQAFIMYAQQGRSWVALFDPVGCRKAWSGLVLKFMESARRAGCRPVFYQVSPEFLPLTVELGMKSFKLGEQAVVDLQNFDLKGGAWLKLRRSINRAVRDGLEFSMLSADDVPAALDELLSVSQAWLQAHNAAEKGFSLGTFQPAYVAAGPVAVIRLHGKIVAFASILSEASGGDAFIDLMRHIPDTHRGMMDLLFVRIMEHLKAEGFKTLNLGMAPLAGLATHSKAPLWNHIGDRIFQNGERFYNFRGVLSFKSKFDPQWQPRYLAVTGRGAPIISMLDVTMLIGGGWKGLLRK
jgi:phosphatidylglycerol lysyltransferase